MNSEIIVAPSAWSKMKIDAEVRYPYECCGFFYGKQHPKTVTDVLSIKNSEEGDQRRRFEISPLDYMKGERFAEENKVELLGIYHSHPDHPATPSEHDRIHAVPVFSYVILSVANGKYRNATSWLLNEERLFENEILTIKDQ
ncbi:MAG: M67 family metallopeptidase [Bacteroidota bacterium]